MLHRTTKSVFAMDSLVEMGEANIPHPVLQAGSKMAGNFGRVSACLSFMASLYSLPQGLERRSIACVHARVCLVVGRLFLVPRL